LWIALLGWALPGGTRPTARMCFAIGLGLVGVALIVGPEQFAGGRRIDPLGALAILVSTLCWASGSLLSRRVNLPASPFLATAMEMLAGGALLTLAGFALGEHRGFDPAAVSLRSLLAVAYLLIFGSLIAFTAYVWLLQVTSPVKVATYAYVNPVVAVFLGWALADEPLSLRTALAAAAILGAVVVITRAAGGAGGASAARVKSREEAARIATDTEP
ncbi:MAG: EamA family transporter, partial [Candidatus Eisenbacteria bacterium]|nr:EamA family transporter [Candidatus Eisenbacteria bacterium]